MNKKKLSVLLIVALSVALLIMAFPFSRVMAKEVTNITLVDVRFSFANGFVFIFSTNGRIGNANLPASVSINGDTFPLNCVVKNDENLIVCHTIKDMDTQPGDTGFITILGRTFIFAAPKVLHVPPAKTSSSPSSLCPAGQSVIYHVDAICSHGMDVSFDVTISPSEDLATVLQEGQDQMVLWGDPFTINDVSFVGCAP